jgi:hypothetical protein
MSSTGGFSEFVAAITDHAGSELFPQMAAVNIELGQHAYSFKYFSKLKE